VVAQDQGAFLVRLGSDTTSVERFTLTGSRLELDQASRAPRAMHRHAVVTLGADGAVTAADVVVSRIGAAADAPPVQHLTATFTRDSAFIESRADTVVRKMAAAVPAGAAIPVISPWAMYDMLSMRLARSHADSLHLPMYYLGGPNLSWVAVRKLGKDSVDIETEFDRYHAKVDGKGKVLGIRPIRGTQQFAVERQEKLDVNAFAATFALREQQGGPAGQYSPRDTATAQAAGATLWIDYGRPSKRGRVIFGGVVPWGEVWRTGANAATQFKTDKALAFGGTVVPAGMYTLWTLPTQNGWTLIINSETGQWGTEHKPEKDLYKIPMSVSANSSTVEKFLIHIAPNDKGGQIHFVWDQTVLAVDFTVQQ
jgi:hypothetical protein